MQFSTIFAIVSAVAVSALPNRIPVVSGPFNTAVDASSTDTKVCGAGNSVSCCNSASGDGGLLGNVLGGSCQTISVPAAIGLDILDGSTCNAANTFCCPTNQDGTLNVALSCIPVTL